MANYKRRKARRRPQCGLCSYHRKHGNGIESAKAKYIAAAKAASQEVTA